MRVGELSCALVFVLAGTGCGRSGTLVPGDGGVPTPDLTDTPSGTPTPLPAAAFRRTMTVAAGTIPGDAQLDGFPVRVSMTGLRSVSNGGPVVTDAGWDITFHDAVGAQLPHEIEHYSPVSGALRAWVSVDIETDEITTFEMRYGAAAEAPTENPAGVWATYEAVWHLDENPGGTAPQALDRSPNGNHGTASGMNDLNLVAGPTGTGMQFDGTNDRIVMGDPASLQITGALTLEAWFAVDVALNTMPGSPRLVDNWSGSAGGWGLFFGGAAENLGIYTADGSIDQTVNSVSVNVGEWHYAAGVWRPTSGEDDEIFLDAVSLQQTNGSNDAISVTGNDPVAIGSDSDGQNPFTGRIDEVRVSGVARTQTWLRGTYESISNPGFVTIGPEEAL